MNINIIAILFLCQFFFSRINAQSFISSKTTEIGGEFSFSLEKSSYEKELSFSSYSFSAYTGVMTYPGLEIGLSPTVAGYNNSNFSVTMFNLYLLPSYNFNLKSNVYPYIEFMAGLGITDDGNSVANVTGLGGDIGFKTKMSEGGLLLVKIEYLHHIVNFQGESDSRNYVPKDYNFDSLTFGVGFRFLIIHNPD